MRRYAAHSRHCGARQEFAAAIFEFFNRTLPDGYESMIDTTAGNFPEFSHDDWLVVG